MMRESLDDSPEGQLERARAFIRALETDIDTARTGAADFEAQIRAARAASASQEIEIANARDSIGKLETEIDAARRGGINLEWQIQAAREASLSQETEIARARDAAGKLEIELDAARRGGADLEAQVDKARDASIDLERQVEAARLANEALITEVTELRDQLRDRSARLSRWIERAVAMERAVRSECLGPRSGDPGSTPLPAAVTAILSTRLRPELIEDWPLVDAVPSEELIHRTSGHRDRVHFARSRAPGLATVLALAEEGGCEVGKLERVLDFGCGGGRLVAAWEPYCPPVEVYGVDLDGDLIDWCRTHLPFADTRCNALDPPLDLPSASFDLIYAASVFTHLTAEAGRRWADELHRLARPGSTLVVSFHGTHYHEILRRSSSSGFDSLHETGFHLARFDLEPGSPDREGSNDYAAFHTEESFRSLFSNCDLRVVARSSERGSTDFASYQDVMVFRRS